MIFSLISHEEDLEDRPSSAGAELPPLTRSLSPSPAEKDILVCFVIEALHRRINGKSIRQTNGLMDK